MKINVWVTKFVSNLFYNYLYFFTHCFKSLKINIKYKYIICFNDLLYNSHPLMTVSQQALWLHTIIPQMRQSAGLFTLKDQILDYFERYFGKMVRLFTLKDQVR